MIKNTFTNIGDHLLMCDAVVSPSGEVIKVTSADKLIIAFMYHRWLYFVVNNKCEYRDSLEYIALRTGNNVKTIERCVSKLYKSGVLLAEKRFDKVKKHNKWFWLGFAKVVYVKSDGNGGMEVIKDEMKEYNPKPHYKKSIENVQQHTPNMDNFEMLVPYSEYDNDSAMSMWEVGL